MSKTVGVASLLTGVVKQEVLRYWELVEREYGSVGVKSFDYPNLGFQGGDCEDVKSLGNELQELILQVNSIEIQIHGFDYFTHPNNVIYLKVVPSTELQQFHKKIHNIMAKHCKTVFSYYIPETWVPHVSIAMEDLTLENLKKFQHNFSEYSPLFKQKLSTIALVEFQKSGKGDLLKEWQYKENTLNL